MARSEALRVVDRWRELGPVVWAESLNGWIIAPGRPVEFTPWQRATHAAWWERHDTVRTLAISLYKKTGKTLTNGVLTCWRWLCLPGLHLIASNDEEQSVGRVFNDIRQMIERHPFLRANTRIEKRVMTFTPTGSQLVAIAQDPAGSSGANFETVSHTELWGLIYPNAERFYSELTPPPTGAYDGFLPLRIVDSYAGLDGDSKAWERVVDNGLAGELVSDEWPIYQRGGTLMIHAEGAEDRARYIRMTPEQAAAYYADEERTLPAGDFTRQHLNRRAQAAVEAISGDAWDAITDSTLGPLAPTKAHPVFAGLDVGVKKDSSAVEVIAPMRGHRARLAQSRIWKPTKGRPVDLGDVLDFLRWLHREFWLAGVFYDPSQALLLAQTLKGEGIRMIEVPQTMGELGPRGTLVLEAVRNRRLVVYRDDELKAAAQSAAFKQVATGWHITKRTARLKVDPIVALSFVLPAVLESAEPLAAGVMADILRRTSVITSRARWGALTGQSLAREGRVGRFKITRYG